MATVRIEPDEWGTFLDDFSRRHEGVVVDVDVLDLAIGAQTAAFTLPLEGVTRDAARDQIAILIGDRRDDHVVHTIGRPTSVYVKRSDDGFDQVLEIESGTQKTLLRLT